MRKKAKASKIVEALIAAGIIDILVCRTTLSNCCYIFGELFFNLGLTRFFCMHAFVMTSILSYETQVFLKK